MEGARGQPGRRTFPSHSRRGADPFGAPTRACVSVPGTAGKRGCLRGAPCPQRLREAPRRGTGRASSRSPVGPAQCPGGCVCCRTLALGVGACPSPTGGVFSEAVQGRVPCSRPVTLDFRKIPLR
ncbi:hypothetical protein HJG60_009981 [Phyllostomus discolor]|uniref:Uncharacterized protein n=1 Tax=Phyllostomus discolor TaxID=89673 RepID=A0A834B3U7_9CHIR|nr:hypothetical protein HJG60_009981 [Phyllostomus discolor]